MNAVNIAAGLVFGARTYDGRRVYQFADAAEIAGAISNFDTVEIRSEFVFRPLRWLKKYDYLDRAPVAHAIWNAAEYIATYRRRNTP